PTRARPSFPTRRSSDLDLITRQAWGVRSKRMADAWCTQAPDDAQMGTLLQRPQTTDGCQCAHDHEPLPLDILMSALVMQSDTFRDRKSTRLNSSHVKIS